MIRIKNVILASATMVGLSTGVVMAEDYKKIHLPSLMKALLAKILKAV